MSALPDASRLRCCGWNATPDTSYGDRPRCVAADPWPHPKHAQCCHCRVASCVTSQLNDTTRNTAVCRQCVQQTRLARIGHIPQLGRLVVAAAAQAQCDDSADGNESKRREVVIRRMRNEGVNELPLAAAAARMSHRRTCPSAQRAASSGRLERKATAAQRRDASAANTQRHKSLRPTQ